MIDHRIFLKLGSYLPLKFDLKTQNVYIFEQWIYRFWKNKKIKKVAWSITSNFHNESKSVYEILIVQVVTWVRWTKSACFLRENNLCSWASPRATTAWRLGRVRAEAVFPLLLPPIKPTLLRRIVIYGRRWPVRLSIEHGAPAFNRYYVYIIIIYNITYFHRYLKMSYNKWRFRFFRTSR